jgi:S-DNA-T family DNA segregation ATPase FtsK/SpoIIIE
MVSNLNKDLARSLGVGSIRIVEVIEGRETIGVEIPNADRESVMLGEVIASKEFEEAKSPLTLAYGKDIEGKPVLEDLASLPHLLIAGTTGSGKSVALNSMLMSILYKANPQEVKLVLIDPKMLELSVYEDLPHLLCPVITDMSEAAYGLRWCVNEMERRYKLMSALSVRNLGGFNSKVNKAIADGNPIKDPTMKIDEEKGITENDIPDLIELPQIVIAVDELADLMMLNAKEVEAPIARLAQLARAVGIHLVVATQRPSVDVITGIIKANFPSRIAFQVATKVDSRTIIDGPGAEKLMGRGDFLYLGSGSSEPTRLHNAFLSLEEVEALMAHVTAQPKPEELVLSSPRETMGAGGLIGEDAGGFDDLFDEAVRLVVMHQQGSISLIQRRLKVGYSRAARLIDEMEQAGIVGTFTGSKARKVLVDDSYLDSLD